MMQSRAGSVLRGQERQQRDGLRIAPVQVLEPERERVVDRQELERPGKLPEQSLLRGRLRVALQVGAVVRGEHDW